MYAAATVVAMVSNRSATVTTMSGWSISNTVGSSRSPSPVDFAIVVGVSPSMISRIRALGRKPSRSMTSTEVPKRSSSVEAAAIVWSSRSSRSSTAARTGLIRA